MDGGDKEDPITAFKRAADALSAKRGIIDRIVSEDEVMMDGGENRGHFFFSWEEVEGQENYEVTSTILLY